jgi:chromosome segregation ATPase
MASEHPSTVEKIRALGDRIAELEAEVASLTARLTEAEEEREEIRRLGALAVGRQDEALAAQREAEQEQERLAELLASQDAAPAEAQDALRPFLAKGFRWKHEGQINAWITKEQWDRARAALGDKGTET